MIQARLGSAIEVRANRILTSAVPQRYPSINADYQAGIGMLSKVGKPRVPRPVITNPRLLATVTLHLLRNGDIGYR